MIGRTVSAPAKVNLYVHILGRRADGYHTLESLVTFASLADTLRVERCEVPEAATAPVDASPKLSLTLDGEFSAQAGAGDGNLVLKTARLLQTYTGTNKSAAFTLTKNIPVGAGLGGGSADAAATLHALNDFWGLGLAPAQLHPLAVQLGADVAMCLAAQPAIARGIGEELAPLPQTLPRLYAVLAHPRVPLLTGPVFAALDLADMAQDTVDFAVCWDTIAGVGALGDGAGYHALCRLLATETRNDLQAPAIAICPVVGDVLKALAALDPTPDLVRMTGSGACCFALYPTAEHARIAADKMRVDYPQWWVQAAQLG